MDIYTTAWVDYVWLWFFVHQVSPAPSSVGFRGCNGMASTDDTKMMWSVSRWMAACTRWWKYDGMIMAWWWNDVSSDILSNFASCWVQKLSNIKCHDWAIDWKLLYWSILKLATLAKLDVFSALRKPLQDFVLGRGSARRCHHWPPWRD